MTETEWLTGTDPGLKLWFLKGKTSERKLRLFACAFPRMHFHLFRDERSRTAVEVAEAFADGKANCEQLAAAKATSESLVDWDHIPDWEGEWAAHPLAKMAALTCGAVMAREAHLVPQMISDIYYYGGADPDYPQSKLTAAANQLTRFAPLIWCVFGNPFRPVAFDRTKLTPAVSALARTIYDDRTFDRLPEVADALERAGCTDADVLAHCRGPGPHVRGCWVVDLLLGKT